MGFSPSIKLLRLVAVLAGLMMLAGLAYATAPKPSPVGQQAGDTPARLVVFAAASLKNALDEAAEAWSARTGGDIVVSYAGSSRLAQQIAQGAPADVFVSANAGWMEFLRQRQVIAAGSEALIAGNRLVLVAHPTANADVIGTSGASGFATAIRRLLSRGPETRLAMAMVAAVPAGIYGKTALQSLGLWEQVRPRVVQGDNVRSALAFVSRGEVDFGLVYASDLAASVSGTSGGATNLQIVAEVPGHLHDPIVYPAAVAAHSSLGEEAQAFVAFLSSDRSQSIFARHGFERPGVRVVSRVR